MNTTSRANVFVLRATHGMEEELDRGATGQSRSTGRRSGGTGGGRPAADCFCRH